MPGRKPAVTANQIFEQLRHFEIFNGLNLKKRNDPVWVELSEALSVYGPMKPINLYFILFQDRHNLMSLYKKEKIINEGVLLDTDNVLHANPEEDEDFKVHKGVSLFESLENLRKDVLYSKYMQDIGFKRFFLMYWSSEQISIHNNLQELTESYVSIDTTFKISRPDGNSNHVFLTVLVTNVENMIVPLSQVLSERYDTNFLRYWLTDWLIAGANPPKRIVLKRSRALLNAVSLAFNKKSYYDYNNYCLSILIGDQCPDKINTQINVDFAHILHSVARWKCFLNIPSTVKEFYLRCIGYMSTITSLNDFQRFLKSVSTVAESQYCDQTCNSSLNAIVGAIKSFEIPNSSRNDSIEDIYQDMFQEEFDEDSLIIRFIQGHIKNPKSGRTEEDLKNQFLIRNDFYFPGVLQPISKLCHEFLCWTNIMNSTFENPHNDAATSASSYLGQLKLTLLHDLLPLREDELFTKHCNEIESDIIKIRSKIQNWYKLKVLIKTTNTGQDCH